MFDIVFNTDQKELRKIMATLTSLDAKLNAVLTAIANISTGDNTAVLAAIAGLKTDVDTNVEGEAPASSGSGAA
jgi:hypothetical protein